MSFHGNTLLHLKKVLEVKFSPLSIVCVWASHKFLLLTVCVWTCACCSNDSACTAHERMSTLGLGWCCSCFHRSLTNNTDTYLSFTALQTPQRTLARTLSQASQSVWGVQCTVKSLLCQIKQNLWWVEMYKCWDYTQPVFSLQYFICLNSAWFLVSKSYYIGFSSKKLSRIVL